MGLLDDFITGYQGASQKASESLGEYFDDYKTWASKNREMVPEAINKFGDYITEAMNIPGVDLAIPMGGPLGYVAKNYRTAEQIQQLRKLMAQENVARGPISSTVERVRAPATLLEPNTRNVLDWAEAQGGGKVPNVEYLSSERARKVPYLPTTEGDIYENVVKDPIDRLYRGSWYHGLSQRARGAVGNQAFDRYDFYRALQEGKSGYSDIPVSAALPTVNETGFPLSLHDAASISNKLGEPAGISLSMLPIKSKEFSADEFIHRVMPLYGGRPSERIVNLMTKEGRNTLNDAYDVVANRSLDMPSFYNSLKGRVTHIEDLEGALGRTLQEQLQTGPFNLALSQELQSMGKRGLLYNPQRWNEYEMLMLDPKFVLPLDYRKFQEYARPNVTRAMRSGSPVGVLDERSATPGIQTGLSQIQDLMSQNASRLGDIYAERPWTQRLNVENKNRLLELVDPEYREIVGNQLFE